MKRVDLRGIIQGVKLRDTIYWERSLAPYDSERGLQSSPLFYFRPDEEIVRNGRGEAVDNSVAALVGVGAGGQVAAEVDL